MGISPSTRVGATDGQLTRREQAVGWAIGYGAALGFVVGGLVGTCLVPIIGTFVGEVCGSVVGAAFGMAQAPIFWLLSSRISSPPWARVGGALGSFGCAVVVVEIAGWGQVRPGIVLLWLGGCTALGCWYGPIAAFGSRPITLGFRRRTRTVGEWAGAAMGWSALAGTAIGAHCGAIIGLVIHWQTAIVATLEGALLGLFFLGIGLIQLVVFLVLGVLLRPDCRSH